ncbi:MAG TPA: MMPL family transporter, partial [Naasia sp.]
MRAFSAFVRSRGSAWTTLLLAFLAIGILFAILPKGASEASPTAGLPESSEAAQVSALLEDFPSADATAGLFVFSRADGAELSENDLSAVGERAAELAELSSTPEAVRPIPSEDGTTALLVVPLEAAEGAEIDELAVELRGLASADLPSGLDARLTGPVGFEADVRGAFAGADLRLLLITAGVVAALLLVTYRSPILWIIPLAVVGTADGLSRFVSTWIADTFDVPVDASIAGILSVLVFGAGTNYALLLVARYREELRHTENRFDAMRTAVTAAGPAIVASGGTVTLSLLVLLLGELTGNRALGIACAAGIVIAIAFALAVLPAALVVCGRGVFWPFVPKPGTDTGKPGFWERVGTGVSRRPAIVAALAVVGLGVLALGLGGYRVGLPQLDQFVGEPESKVGQEILAEQFPDAAAPTTVLIAPDAAAG